jgi:hypothetical protein
MVALLVADVRLQFVAWQLGWFEVKDPRTKILVRALFRTGDGDTCGCR